MSVKNKKESYFWTSYSDLMTSMFFVMLVLFVLAIAMLHHKVVEMQVTLKQYEQILQLEKQFEELSQSTDLTYIEDKKMFVAKDFIGVEIFNTNDATIKQEYLETVDRVGQSLLHIIQRLYKSNPNMQFQLVIEGNAAIPWQQKRDKTYNPDNTNMYNLSYARALALYMRWKDNGINLREYNTEVIIAGSGFNGINRDNKVEENNKRFIVQIIPKPNNFTNKNSK